MGTAQFLALATLNVKCVWKALQYRRQICGLGTAHAEPYRQPVWRKIRGNIVGDGGEFQ